MYCLWIGDCLPKVSWHVDKHWGMSRQYRTSLITHGQSASAQINVLTPEQACQTIPSLVGHNVITIAVHVKLHKSNFWVEFLECTGWILRFYVRSKINVLPLKLMSKGSALCNGPPNSTTFPFLAQFVLSTRHWLPLQWNLCTCIVWSPAGPPEKLSSYLAYFNTETVLFIVWYRTACECNPSDIHFGTI